MRHRNGPRARAAIGAWLAPAVVFAGVLAFSVAIGKRASNAAFGTYAATRVEGRSFPKTLVGTDGKHVLARPPARIVSLTVTADEILSRLVAPERLAAVSRFADDPAISLVAGSVPARAARVRGSNPENIIALEPDLVFVAHYTLDSAVKILGAAGIACVRFRDVHGFADVAENVRLTAEAVGETARAEGLLAEMSGRLARVAERVRGRPRPRVLYFSPADYTSGRGTLVDEKIERAGGVNAAAELGLVGDKSVSLDVLVGLDPDVIVTPRWSADEQAALRAITANPAWQSARAVQSGRVYTLRAAALTSEAPDGVVGVEELARVLHPEAFSS